MNESYKEPVPVEPTPIEQSLKPIIEGATSAEGVPSIEACVVNPDEDNPELASVNERIDEDSDVVHWVDFDGGDLDKLKEAGFKHDGELSYLVSPIADRDWFSDHYMSCTAVIAFGRSKETGRVIALLSHQDPNYFVDGGPEKSAKFAGELNASLSELRDLSEMGSVEVGIAGGNFNSDVQEGDYKHSQYVESIKRLRQIIQETLGFDPKVLAGPNNNVGSETRITIDTQARKVWIEKSEQSEVFNEAFQASGLEEQVKKW